MIGVYAVQVLLSHDVLKSVITASNFSHHVFQGLVDLNCFLAHPASRKPKVGCIFHLCFSKYFSDFFQTNYVNIHLTDLLPWKAIFC